MTTTYIAVCPNHCDASFITEAKVTQSWEVDAYGEQIFIRDDCVTADLPYMESWKCSKCGASATVHECVHFDFAEEDLSGTLLVPDNALKVGYVFWDDKKRGALLSAPIDCGINPVPHAVVKGYTIWFSMAKEVMDGHDLTYFGEGPGGSAMYLELPRRECEGQLDLYSVA